jgi:hypothetical protein
MGVAQERGEITQTHSITQTIEGESVRMTLRRTVNVRYKMAGGATDPEERQPARAMVARAVLIPAVVASLREPVGKDPALHVP